MVEQQKHSRLTANQCGRKNSSPSVRIRQSIIGCSTCPGVSVLQHRNTFHSFLDFSEVVVPLVLLCFSAILNALYCYVALCKGYKYCLITSLLEKLNNDAIQILSIYISFVKQSTHHCCESRSSHGCK